MIHTDPHKLAGQTVTLNATATDRRPYGLMSAESRAGWPPGAGRWYAPLPRRYGPVCDRCWLTGGQVRALRWCPHGGVS